MLKLVVISVTGDDAGEFLQGQLTNDIGRLTTDDEILSAWCSPKGRVLWLGTVTQIDNGYALSALAENAEDIVRRMIVFRFRAKADFEVIDAGQTADPESLIEKGYPWIGAAQMEQFTPHMLNLDLLDAISLEKGCYTGQEIVARTHFKGATKRRTLRFDCDGPVNEGDKVQLGERSIGEVLNVAGRSLLAVVPVDKAGESLSVRGALLTHRKLPYLNL